jgi:hypothetical protein
MFALLSGIGPRRAGRRVSANTRTNRRPARRLGLEHLEQRKLMDASGIGAEISSLTADLITAVAPGMVVPQQSEFSRGDEQDLLGGGKFVWDSPRTGRQIDAGGAESRFIGVQIVRNPNITTCPEGSDQCSRVVSGALPPGATLLGVFHEPDPDADSPALRQRVYIYGIDGRLDVDRSDTVDLIDLVAMARHLNDVYAARAAGVSNPAELYDAAMDVNGDGDNTIADLLAIVHHLRQDVRSDNIAPARPTESFFYDGETDRDESQEFFALQGPGASLE